MELASVAALAENSVIGNEGELPWESIPADKKQYRERVANSPVILGRRTYESMLADLPGRVQIVLSRTEQEFDVDTAYYVDSVASARELAAGFNPERAYVLGGGGIYELFQPHLDRMFLSRVHGEYNGDIYYPEWDSSEWELIEETAYDRFTLEEWVRVET